MRCIVRLLHVVLLVLILATTSFRSATAQDAYLLDCKYSMLDSILQAQYMDPANVSDEDEAAAEQVAMQICNSMEAAGIPRDDLTSTADAVVTCWQILLPDRPTEEEAHGTFIGCSRAVIQGRSAPLNEGILGECLQAARAEGLNPDTSDYLDALTLCYFSRLAREQMNCPPRGERPGDLVLATAFKIQPLAQTPECEAPPPASAAVPAAPPPSPPLADDGLGNHITERGPSWTGSWTREQGTTTWKATYAGGTGAPTTMTVTRTATTLSAIRTQSSDGNLCRYEGNFTDARMVTGTATCPGSNQTNVTTFPFTLTLDDR